MGLKQYLHPLFRWWWLIVLTTGIATGAAYFATRRLPPIYRAHTTVAVGQAIYDPNPTTYDFGLAQQLASVYVAIAQGQGVQQAALAALGLDRLPEYDVRMVAGGSFIEIAVIDASPERAQAVARELASQLILQSPAGVPSESQLREAFVREQLDKLETKISETEAEIETLQDDLAAITSARELNDAQQELAALQNKLVLLQSNYATLLSSTLSGATNILNVVEPANLPTYPIGPNRLALTLLAAACGLALAVGAAYGLEYFDDGLRSVEDVSRALDLPILAQLSEARHARAHPIFVMDAKDPLAVEAYRSLRSNLVFAARGQRLKSILITSPMAADGKSTVALNLAATLVRTGRRVALVDADLRNPSLHQRLGLPNEAGLSDVLDSGGPVEAVASAAFDARLQFVSAGRARDNASELLSSAAMAASLAQLAEHNDFVLIDAPPILISDAWGLAGLVDGVLLIVRPGHTRARAARAAVAQLEHTGAHLLGVALNRVRAAASDYYAYYYTRPRAAHDEELPVWGSNGRHAPVPASDPDLRPAQVRPSLEPPTQLPDQQLPAPDPIPPALAADDPPDLPVTTGPPAPAEVSGAPWPQAAADLLTGVHKLLAEELTLGATFRDTLRLAVRRFGAVSGCLAWVGPDRRVIAGATALRGDIQPIPAGTLASTLEYGLAGWVLEKHQATLATCAGDAALEQLAARDDVGNGARAVMCAPLLQAGRAVGVLALGYRDLEYCRQDDLALLTLIASRLADVLSQHFELQRRNHGSQ